MSKCSYKKEKKDNGTLEFGNMNFKICSEDEPQMYNGSLQIKNGRISINLDITLKKIRIIAKANNLLMNSKKLDAPHVLADTIENIIEAIKFEQNVYAAPNIFEEMFNQSVNVENSKKNNYFSIIYQQLLLKGAGDIFQEINAIAKYGGYQEKNITNKLNPFDIHGNALRCFVANDRVSVIRFLFIKRWGRKSEINEKAFGGYILSGLSSGSNIGISNKVLITGGSNKVLNKRHSFKFKNILINIIDKRNTRKKNKIGKNITINITL